jgi:hypothetical protein
MSDGSANQRVHDDLARSLRDVGADELVELLSDLIKIYVIEGTSALDIEPSLVPPSDSRERVSFARLITDLKARLSVPELEHFRVEGDRVLITIGDQTFPLDGAPRRPRPAAADSPKPAASPKRDEGKKPFSGERSRLLEVD